MPKPRRLQQGGQPSEERESNRKSMKTITETNTDNKVFGKAKTKSQQDTKILKLFINCGIKGKPQSIYTQ